MTSKEQFDELYHDIECDWLDVCDNLVGISKREQELYELLSAMENMRKNPDKKHLDELYKRYRKI